MAYLKIIRLKSATSTNDYALKLALKGAAEITVVRAASQTRGRGSRSRKWVSPHGGIYVSLIFRPNAVLSELKFWPLLFSLGVVRTLTEIQGVKIKPPNDVTVRGRKIAGVLVESRGGGQNPDFIIVGIGININTSQADLPDKATSLYLETGTIQNTDKIFERLIGETISLYKQFTAGKIKVLQRRIAAFTKL